MGRKPIKRCAESDVALKSFFLGPMAENSGMVSELVHAILGQWYDYRRSHFPEDGSCITPRDQALPEFQSRKQDIRQAVDEVLKLYSREIPKHTLRYLGHMSSEISIPGLIGQFIGTIYNPNLISSEVAKVGAQIEEQAIRSLLRLMGYQVHRGMGHFTSGGTIANFEAIERAIALSAKQSVLRPIVIVPENRHYSWDKGFRIFGIREDCIRKVRLDENARLSIPHLKVILDETIRARRPVAMMVSVAGSTEFGGIDPIHQINRLLKDAERRMGYRIWHHVDAAYGGFFRAAMKVPNSGLSQEALLSLRGISEATSVTIDPHKLGFIPYSCGVFLTRDRQDYGLVSMDAPYLNYEDAIDRGAYTLEGSRPAGGATATLLTERCLGFDANGLGRILSRTVKSRIDFEKHLKRVPGVVLLPSNQTNIICFFLRSKSGSIRRSSQMTRDFYEKHKGTVVSDYYVSKTALSPQLHQQMWNKITKQHQMKQDGDELLAIRLCLMNPFLGSKEFEINLYADFAAKLKLRK